jgi:hypothetical protein
MNTNLLNLNNDISNIISVVCDYDKKDILEEYIYIYIYIYIYKSMNEEQIINGKKNPAFDWSIHNRLMIEEDHEPIKDQRTIPNDWIKRYKFDYIYAEIIEIKIF